MASIDLFPHRQHRTFSSRKVVSDFFRLDGDMSPVERSFIADLLDEYTDHEYRFQWNEDFRHRIINDRFRSCGQQGSRFACPDCAITYYTRYFCKHKLCDICARISGGHTRKKIVALIDPIFANKKKGWTVALLTLSESSAKYRGRYPNKEEYKTFNRHVGLFCRLWYGKFKGKWTKKGNIAENRKRYQGAGWFGVNEFGTNNTNLHCHILLYGPWIPHSKLLASWIRITGGDTGCHIEPVRNPQKASNYVAKYLTKAPRFLDPNTAVDFVTATHRQRRIRTGGMFYNAIKKVKVARPADECPFCDMPLHFDGICRLSESSSGLNLKYVMDNRELFETDLLKSRVAMLPGGAIPAGLPHTPGLLPN